MNRFGVIKKGVVYCPPDQVEIRQFVQAACQRMGERLDSALDTPEMRTELTAFFTVVATIYAKYLTKQASQSLDNDAPNE